MASEDVGDSDVWAYLIGLADRANMDEIAGTYVAVAEWGCQTCSKLAVSTN